VLRVRVLLTSFLLAAVLAVIGVPEGPAAAHAASCADHSTQAEAQAAKDTRDGDGDGRYCEDLPCPCAGDSQGGGGAGSSTSPAPPAPKAKPAPKPGTSADPAGCTIVKKTASVGLSKTKYREVRAHWDRAIAKGYPRILTVHRKGAERRRARLLAGIDSAPGQDRDEYPMAMARTTVKADVELVDSSQNRGAGSVQGTKLRRYCSGQRLKVVWY
jgi:hypothetical protein